MRGGTANRRRQADAVLEEEGDEEVKQTHLKPTSPRAGDAKTTPRVLSRLDRSTVPSSCGPVAVGQERLPNARLGLLVFESTSLRV